MKKRVKHSGCSKLQSNYSKTFMSNVKYLLLFGVLFLLLIFVAPHNHSLGMLILGAMFFLPIIGCDVYRTEHPVYEEIERSKRELLNYDKESVSNSDEEPHLQTYKLFVVIALIACTVLCAYASVELGMILLGADIFYMILASEK